MEQDFLERQIRRMAQLDNFPKFDPEAEGELVIIAGKHGRSEAHLRGVIEEIMSVWTTCPKPSELRSLLLLGSDEPVNLKCKDCGGSGWKIIERNGISGAARCQCGSVPRHTGESVPFDREAAKQAFQEWFPDETKDSVN
jgi:hypothetical protein